MIGRFDSPRENRRAAQPTSATVFVVEDDASMRRSLAHEVTIISPIDQERRRAMA